VVPHSWQKTEESRKEEKKENKGFVSGIATKNIFGEKPAKKPGNGHFAGLTRKRGGKRETTCPNGQKSHIVIRWVGKGLPGYQAKENSSERKKERKRRGKESFFQKLHERGRI